MFDPNEKDPAVRVAAALSEFVAVSAYRLAHTPHAEPDSGEMASYHRFTDELRDALAMRGGNTLRLLGAVSLSSEAMERRLMRALELAWGIIANAGGGDWTRESPEWQAAAARWRDEEWHPALDRHGYPPREVPNAD